MGSAEIPQRHRLLVAGQIVCELAAVLHQLHPRLQGLLHHSQQLRHRAGDQIQPLSRQPLAAALIRQQAGFQVVEPVAAVLRHARQLRIAAAAKFLQHPQRLLGAGAVGGHHGGVAALLLGRMGQTSGAIGGGVAGLAVAGQMAAAQLLAQVLEAFHQIAAIEAKAGPVFGHPQALAGTIEVGVQQPQHRRINAFRRNGQATGARAVFYLA